MSKSTYLIVSLGLQKINQYDGKGCTRIFMIERFEAIGAYEISKVYYK